MFDMLMSNKRKSDLKDILPANLLKSPEERTIVHKFKLPDGRIRTITITPLKNPIEEQVMASPLVNKDVLFGNDYRENTFFA